MEIDFTERCHALFNLVMESVLCFLHERPVGLYYFAKVICYIRAVFSKVTFSISGENQTPELNVYQSGHISQSAGVNKQSTGVAYL